MHGLHGCKQLPVRRIHPFPYCAYLCKRLFTMRMKQPESAQRVCRMQFFVLRHIRQFGWKAIQHFRPCTLSQIQIPQPSRHVQPRTDAQCCQFLFDLRQIRRSSGTIAHPKCIILCAYPHKSPCAIPLQCVKNLCLPFFEIKHCSEETVLVPCHAQQQTFH